MMDQQENFVDAVATIKKLTMDGILGFYTHFEVTEIILNDGSSVFNLFTLLVAENRVESDISLNEPPHFLNNERIYFDDIDSKKFVGIYRYYKKIETVLNELEGFLESKSWNLSGNTLYISELIANPKQFVATNSFDDYIPLNRVLKNNFFNGSYIFEFFDISKTNVSFILENLKILQKISEGVQKYIPIKLETLSDRLGNIIFQIPVTILSYSRINSKNWHQQTIRIKWHPDAIPRPLQISSENNYDKVIRSYFCEPIIDEEITIPHDTSNGDPAYLIYDPQHKVILAATSPGNFITSINFTLMAITDSPKPSREFTYKINNDERKEKISFFHTNQSNIEHPNPPPEYGTTWISKRLAEDSKKELIASRDFYQYIPSKEKRINHEDALKDIQMLISRHGKRSVWLLDPYLASNDILCTLIHNPNLNSDMRALCSNKAYKSKEGYDQWRNDQKSNLETSIQNPLGLKIEYRMGKEFAFHDRFLIFPGDKSPDQVWSLGSSINNFGNSHHLLYKVTHGHLVKDLFEEIWSKCQDEESLIWSYK